MNVALAIISALISASSFWVAVQRYKREVARKQLTYSLSAKKRQAAIIILVRNSGNILIEPDDYISPLGFDFGEGAQVHEATVEYQVPEDLDTSVTVVDSRKLEILPALLNPEDRFAVRVFLKFPEKLAWQKAEYLTARVDPKPYGRIRGTHKALQKRKRIIISVTLLLVLFGMFFLFVTLLILAAST